MGTTRQDLRLELSEAERSLLQDIANGKRYGDISALRKVSVPVIEQRVMHLKNKLGAQTTAGAVAIGFRKGWLK